MMKMAFCYTCDERNLTRFHWTPDCEEKHKQHKPPHVWKINGQRGGSLRTGSWYYPVKFGLYSYGRITANNIRQIHAEEDCPYNNGNANANTTSTD